MGALENVFGHDVKLDAKGQPIEQGFGNLTSQAAAAKTVQAAQASTIVADAKAQAAKILSDAKASAATLVAAAAPAAAPAVVSDVVAPVAVAEPPAAGVTVPPAPVVPVAPAPETLLQKVEDVLHKGEQAIEQEIKDLVKDL